MRIFSCLYVTPRHSGGAIAGKVIAVQITAYFFKSLEDSAIARNGDGPMLLWVIVSEAVMRLHSASRSLQSKIFILAYSRTAAASVKSGLITSALSKATIASLYRRRSLNAFPRPSHASARFD